MLQWLTKDSVNAMREEFRSAGDVLVKGIKEARDGVCFSQGAFYAFPKISNSAAVVSN